MTGTAQEPGTEPAVGRVLVLVGLAVAWVLVAPGMLLDAADTVPGLLEWWPETPADDSWREPARAAALRATAVAAGIPAVGLVLALRWHRAVAAALFGCLAVLGLVAGLWVHGLALPDAPESDPYEDRPPVCQEHSGGDTRCPGG